MKKDFKKVKEIALRLPSKFLEDCVTVGDYVAIGSVSRNVSLVFPISHVLMGQIERPIEYIMKYGDVKR